MSSTVIHSTGTVVATSSGQRSPLALDESDNYSQESDSESEHDSGEDGWRRRI